MGSEPIKRYVPLYSSRLLGSGLPIQRGRIHVTAARAFRCHPCALRRPRGAPRTPRPRGDSHEEHRADFGFLGDMRCNDPQPRRDSDRHPGPDDRDGIHTTASHTARASLVQRRGRWVPLSLGLYESRPLCLCETQRRPEHLYGGVGQLHRPGDRQAPAVLRRQDGLQRPDPQGPVQRDRPEWR